MRNNSGNGRWASLRALVGVAMVVAALAGASSAYGWNTYNYCNGCALNVGETFWHPTGHYIHAVGGNSTGTAYTCVASDGWTGGGAPHLIDSVCCDVTYCAALSSLSDSNTVFSYPAIHNHGPYYSHYQGVFSYTT